MRILHLYPDLMNLYGDYGNIAVLKKHLEDQGEKVTVEKNHVAPPSSQDEALSRYSASGEVPR